MFVRRHQNNTPITSYTNDETGLYIQTYMIPAQVSLQFMYRKYIRLIFA